MEKVRCDVEIPQFGSGSAEAYVTAADERYSGKLVWRIWLVKEYPKDKRRKPIEHRVNTDSYEYRRLPIEERNDYEDAFFRSLLGEETYKDVLRKAWMMCKPECLNEEEK